MTTVLCDLVLRSWWGAVWRRHASATESVARVRSRLAGKLCPMCVSSAWRCRSATRRRWRSKLAETDDHENDVSSPFREVVDRSPRTSWSTTPSRRTTVCPTARSALSEHVDGTIYTPRRHCRHRQGMQGGKEDRRGGRRKVQRLMVKRENMEREVEGLKERPLRRFLYVI